VFAMMGAVAVSRALAPARSRKDVPLGHTLRTLLGTRLHALVQSDVTHRTLFAILAKSQPGSHHIKSQVGDFTVALISVTRSAAFKNTQLFSRTTIAVWHRQL
jgi:hypothetical protein